MENLENPELLENLEISDQKERMVSPEAPVPMAVPVNVENKEQRESVVYRDHPDPLELVARLVKMVKWVNLEILVQMDFLERTDNAVHLVSLESPESRVPLVWQENVASKAPTEVLDSKDLSV